MAQEEHGELKWYVSLRLVSGSSNVVHVARLFRVSLIQLECNSRTRTDLLVPKAICAAVEPEEIQLLPGSPGEAAGDHYQIARLERAGRDANRDSSLRLSISSCHRCASPVRPLTSMNRNGWGRTSWNPRQCPRWSTCRLLSYRLEIE